VDNEQLQPPRFGTDSFGLGLGTRGLWVKMARRVTQKIFP
jgi:hypothetical protein